MFPNILKNKDIKPQIAIFDNTIFHDVLNNPYLIQVLKSGSTNVIDYMLNKENLAKLFETAKKTNEMPLLRKINIIFRDISDFVNPLTEKENISCILKIYQEIENPTEIDVFRIGIISNYLSKAIDMLGHEVHEKIEEEDWRNIINHINLTSVQMFLRSCLGSYDIKVHHEVRFFFNMLKDYSQVKKLRNSDKDQYNFKVSSLLQVISEYFEMDFDKNIPKNEFVDSLENIWKNLTVDIERKELFRLATLIPKECDFIMKRAYTYNSYIPNETNEAAIKYLTVHFDSKMNPIPLIRMICNILSHYGGNSLVFNTLIELIEKMRCNKIFCENMKKLIAYFWDGLLSEKNIMSLDYSSLEDTSIDTPKLKAQTEDGNTETSESNKQIDDVPFIFTTVATRAFLLRAAEIIDDIDIPLLVGWPKFKEKCLVPFINGNQINVDCTCFPSEYDILDSWVINLRDDFLKQLLSPIENPDKPIIEKIELDIPKKEKEDQTETNTSHNSENKSDNSSEKGNQIEYSGDYSYNVNDDEDFENEL
ncbi:hypothetical protein TRFO_37060 [Tritrichomonas foetus]|uniref:Uncharacterized protein n=1 Tax=Tritrichomonas foetus TaxID=1144522 RepID=A0A1J4JDJ0_9EUKA|nr:hypothetical protein TRFO_37060 [Tritrichomonas foetus]|eukprot:OHS96721.1 hypothetical protein TRFO_37060 [Tritrichomonas foetus]